MPSNIAFFLTPARPACIVTMRMPGRGACRGERCAASRHITPMKYSPAAHYDVDIVIGFRRVLAAAALSPHMLPGYRPTGIAFDTGSRPRSSSRSTAIMPCRLSAAAAILQATTISLGAASRNHFLRRRHLIAMMSGIICRAGPFDRVASIRRRRAVHLKALFFNDGRWRGFAGRRSASER